MKKTLILGASPDASRFAYKAAHMLTDYGHEIALVGMKSGEVAGQKILKGNPGVEGVHTITLYVGPKNQTDLYEYIISLKPERIIFNPGTENDELIHLAEKNNIEAVVGCTLVMLAAGTY
jgi:predicted CoA-binding protein